MSSDFIAPGARTLTEEGGVRQLVCDSWELRETALPLRSVVPLSESLFSVGNGHIGVRGYAEESMMGGSTYSSPPSRRTLVEVEQTTVSRETEVPEHSLRGTYVNGIYEERLLSHQRAFTLGTCVRECFLIRVPDAFCFDLFVGGEHVSTASGSVVSHTRVLDLRTGELHRRMTWLSAHHNREVTIETHRFVSAARKNIAATRYVVSARNVSNTDIRIVSRTTLPEGERQRYLRIENVVARCTMNNASSAMCVRSRTSCKRLAVAASESCTSSFTDAGLGLYPAAGSTSLAGTADSTMANSLDEVFLLSGSGKGTGTQSGGSGPGNPLVSPTSHGHAGAVVGTVVSPRCTETEWGAETIFTSILNDKTRLVLTKYVAYLSDEDAPPEDINDLALHVAHQAAEAGYEGLFAEQRKELTKFWDSADVRIRGKDPSVQGAFRFNILQLYMSAGRFRLQGFPTRGLTGELFGGLHQWDVEAFIVPFFTHTHPETARALLQFRIDTLPQAREIAADMDLPNGALYPPRTVNGGDNSASTTCAAHLHVNAVIAYAIRQYVTATNDTSLLLKGGAHVVFSTALVWILWGTWDKGKLHFRSVAGPDEYSGMADNNFFTNIMAKDHLQWAVQLVAMLREKHPREWQSIKEHCGVTDEDITLMENAASHIALFFDATDRVHPVDQAFMRKKPWTFGDIKGAGGGSGGGGFIGIRDGDSGKKSVLLKRYHPNVIFRHQVCKVPDVMLAAMLVPDALTRDEVMADFKFYEAITTRDSAISLPIYSIISSRLGMHEKAESYFNQALLVDIENVNGNTGGGLHSSAAAGSWLCLVSGFAGMRVTKGVIHFDPALPKDWEEYQFHARHHGFFLRVSVNHRVVTYAVIDGPPDVELLVIHAGTSRLHLSKGAPQFVRLNRDARALHFDAVIFDLDSVIEAVEEDHFEAWKATLEPLVARLTGTASALTRELYLAYLRHGRPHVGIQRFLAQCGVGEFPLGTPTDPPGDSTLFALCNRKLEQFRVVVKARGLRVRQGVLPLIAELRHSGVAVGCVTSSKNGKWLQHEEPQLAKNIDFFLDGVVGDTMGLRWRPDVDYFDECARRLDASPKRTILVVDGIDGFSKSALHKYLLIVDTSTDPEIVKDWSVTRLCIPCLSDLTLDILDEEASRDSHMNSLSKRRAQGVVVQLERHGGLGNALCT